MSELESIAKATYDAAQEAAAADEDLNGAVLLGIYVIAEWSGQDEVAYLTQHSRGVDERGLTNWRSLGYLHWAAETNKPMPEWLGGVAEDEEGEDDD